MHHNEPGWRRLRRLIAIQLIAAGALLLLTTVGYYIYGAFAKSNLDDLNVERDRPSMDVARSGVGKYPDAQKPVSPTGIPLNADAPAGTPTAVVSPASDNNNDGQYVPEPPNGERKGDIPTVQPAGEPVIAHPEPDSQDAPPTPEPSLTPTPEPTVVRVGEYLNKNSQQSQKNTGNTVDDTAGTDSQTGDSGSATGTNDPLLSEYPPEGGKYPYTLNGIQKLFGPFGIVNDDLLPDKLSTATRIIIPAINVDSPVVELQLDFSREDMVWESPKWAVGHIPHSAVPGENKLGWYFGHLESPLKGEGDVFTRLPQIPELLNQGEQIYVILQTADRSYLYEVYKTGWVTGEDLVIFDSGLSDIVLVSCYPKFIYSHRVLVTAALIGMTTSPPTELASN